jgi:purine-nucleoside phosphorylase
METPLAQEAAAALAAATGVPSHDLAVVLGSGWSGSVHALGAPVADLAGADLAGFAPAAVEGHAGRVRSLVVAGRPVLAFLGRTHYYERRDPQEVAHAVRVAAWRSSACRS